MNITTNRSLYLRPDQGRTWYGTAGRHQAGFVRLGDCATDLSKLGAKFEDGKTDQSVDGQAAHPAKTCKAH